MSKKRSWVVQVRCLVLKELVCENCTKEDAESLPFDFAEDEREIDRLDFDVVSVEENL